MISLAPGTKVYLASKPVSMRLGFDGLAALVRPLFSVEPYCGHVFLFRSKSGTYLKALHWDGSGSACSPSVWSAIASCGRRWSRAAWC